MAEAVALLDGRAWIFSQLLAPDRFTEFVEWPASADTPIIEREPVAGAMQQLDNVFPSEESDTWLQASF